jgi:hypothetical protein
MARGFFSVPTSFLEFDPATSSTTGKMSPEELRRAMSSLPDIYQMRAAGYGDGDFRRMRDEPATEADKVRGTTYLSLFTASGQPLRAEFIDQKGLVVIAGQHRALEAKRLCIPYLPMHVTAPDREQLVHIREACEVETRRLTPEMPTVPELDRDLDSRLYGQERGPYGDRQAGPEALEQVRERGWESPEVDRDLWWRGRGERRER